MSAWAVTGVGIIAATGDSSGCLFEALCSRESLVGALEGGPGATHALPIAPIKGFDPKVYIARKGLRDLSRVSQLACAAAAEVAGIVEDLDGEDVGVAFGSAWGSLKTIVDFERAAHVNGPRFVDPLLFTETVSNVPGGQISIFNGWSAFNVTVSAGASSGLAAIGDAIALLEDGRARAAVAGGADELDPPLLRALLREGRLAPSPGSFPFCEGRLGPSGGEAACLVVIEDEAGAHRRGAAPIGRVRAPGGAFAGDAGATRLAECIGAALDGSGLRPQDIDLLVLSGSGSPEGDRQEAAAVIDVFGSGPSAPPVLAPKAIVGETWGASGPIALVAALEAIRSGTIPALARGAVLAPEAAGLNFPSETLARRVRHALVIGATESGHLGCLVVSEPS